MRWRATLAVFGFTAPITVSPAALSWLTGNWLGQNGQDRVEEHWSPLGGNTLMGMYRWVTEGPVRFSELLALEQEGKGVFLRIKHFDPKLVGWEEKARAHEFVLVQLQGQGAIFLALDKPEARWAVYRREGQERLVSYFTREDEPDTATGLFEYGRQ
jgi:Domain of unknown function (DUF6265)